MNRKKYKMIGVVLFIAAFLQYIVLGCIVSRLAASEWLENISTILMFSLSSAGMAMLVNARSEKSYKKVLIEEQDERNKLINLSACGAALVVAFFSYVGVFVYLRSAGIISGMQTLIISIPVFAGVIAYGVAAFYYSKRM